MHRADRARERAARERAEIAERLEAMAPDAEGLEVGRMLDKLEDARFDDGEPLVSRASAAAADMARRISERDEARADARRIENGIEAGADPADLVLPKPVIAALRDAAQDVRAAGRSHVDAAYALIEAQADLGEPETMPEGAGELADALDAHATLPFDLDDLDRTLRERRAVARALAAGLPSDWRALADAGLPTEAEIRAVERDLTGAIGRSDQAETRLREAAGKRDARTAEHEAEQIRVWV